MHIKPFHNVWKNLTVLLFAGIFFLGGCGGRDEDLMLFEEELTAGSEKVLQEAVLPEQTPIPEPAGAAQEESAAANEEAKAQQERTVAVCIVHICGAVENPGVYELPKQSRVMDAVDAAGGFLEDADPEACNLAQPLVDGCQIYIMTREESSALAQEPENARTLSKRAGILEQAPLGDPQNAVAQETAEGGKVNINTADTAALLTLPGIGESRAAAILAFRQENGAFSCIEDIMKVSGIKQAAFDKIKDKITV